MPQQSADILPGVHLKYIASDLVRELPLHNGPWEEEPRLLASGRYNLQWAISHEGLIGKRIAADKYDKTPLIYDGICLVDKDHTEGWGREPDHKTNALEAHLNAVLKGIGFNLEERWGGSTMTEHLPFQEASYIRIGGNRLVIPDTRAIVYHAQRPLVAEAVYERVYRGHTLTGFLPVGFQISQTPSQK